MKNTPKNSIKTGNKEFWETVGTNKKNIKTASQEEQKKIDEVLGLQMISIRLPQVLINNLKHLAKDDGIGYQPYIRQLLTKHVRQVHHEKQARKGKIKNKELYPSR